MCKIRGVTMRQIFRETKSRISFFERTTLNFPAHIHDEIELVYVKRGGGTACREGEKYILTTNDLFLVFPNQVHYYMDFEEGAYLVLILHPSCLLSYGQVFLEGELNGSSGHLSLIGNDTLTCLIETAYREFVQEGYSDIIAAYLTALFGKLISYCNIEKATTPASSVLKVLQYCANHYKEDITVDMVAGELFVSRSCVSHIFSDRIRMGFCDYINAWRLNEAEELLRNKHYTITEVANLSGFPTIRTFNRVFLKKHGISPTAYRKMLNK